MPCTGNITGEELSQMMAQDAYSAVRNLNNEIGQLTSVLCCICTDLEKQGRIDEVLVDTNARIWWDNHKKIDQKQRKK